MGQDSHDRKTGTGEASRRVETGQPGYGSEDRMARKGLHGLDGQYRKAGSGQYLRRNMLRP
jgi:hypothetical protein